MTIVDSMALVFFFFLKSFARFYISVVE